MVQITFQVEIFVNLVIQNKLKITQLLISNFKDTFMSCEFCRSDYIYVFFLNYVTNEDLTFDLD